MFKQKVTKQTLKGEGGDANAFRPQILKLMVSAADRSRDGRVRKKGSSKSRAPVKMVPASIGVVINSPTNGQVFVGSMAGVEIPISVQTSSAVNSVQVLVWSGKLAQPPDPQYFSSFVWEDFLTPSSDSFSWTGTIPALLGWFTLQAVASDSSGNVSQSALASVLVTLPISSFDVDSIYYLQSLVNFACQPFDWKGTARILTEQNVAPTLNDLDSTFGQSLSLLLDGDYGVKANETVSQARICVEVLRKYLAGNASTTSQQQILANAQQAYELSAYSTMLQRLGTSFDEIRLAQSYSDDDQKLQVLLDRLGITLTSPDATASDPTHLNQLCFAPSDPTTTTLTFELTVTDSTGAIAKISSDVVISFGTNPAFVIGVGPNQTVNSGDAVKLNYQPSGPTASCVWAQTNGPDVGVTGATTAEVSFVAPTVAADSMFTFRADITNPDGARASATVRVYVTAAQSPLTVSSGFSRTALASDPEVTLAGKASTTTSGATIVSYLWSQTAGPKVQIAGSATPSAHILLPSRTQNPVQRLSEELLEETFSIVSTFRDPFSRGATIVSAGVQRWDLAGAYWSRSTDADGIAYLKVTAGTPVTLELFADEAMTKAIASGQGQAPGEIVLWPVSGSGVSGRVFLVAPPSGQTLMAELSVFPRFLSWQFQRLRSDWLIEDFPADTSLVFQLTVTDSIGTTASILVSVNVCHISRPNVTAGPSRTALPGDKVTLTGSAATGTTVTSFQWSQFAGPTVPLDNNDTSAATFIAPAYAVDTGLAFLLTVTDANNRTSTTRVDVLIYHINRLLTASAGNNQTTNGGSTVTLTATSTSAIAMTPSYQWTQVQGQGPLVTLSNGGSGKTVTFAAPGVNADTLLSFEVAVTDGATGAIATSVVSVTVYAANHALLVSAGPSQTVAEGSTVSLVGSGTEANATLSYQWAQIAGPEVDLTGANTSSASFAAPAVTDDTILSFQLTVTDGSGVTASATAQVLVYRIEEPVAVSSTGNQTVDELTFVQLVGSATDQKPGATIVSYQWAQVAGPQVTLQANGPNGISFYLAGGVPAIIDPDMLNLLDFRDANAPYAGLLTARQTQVQSWLTTLQSARSTAATEADGLNATIVEALGQNGPSQLQSLNEQLNAGVDITSQLGQLGLSMSGFNYLLTLLTLVEGNQFLLDSEWDDAQSILLQCQKIQNFQGWRTEEVDAELALSPDVFTYPSPSPVLPTTGLDSSGSPLPYGNADLRWQIIVAPSGNLPAPVYVTNNSFPVGVAWLADDEDSAWISPQADEHIGDSPGQYIYRTSIDLTGYDPSSVSLGADTAVAGAQVSDVRLNGESLGLSTAGGGVFIPLSILGSFATGVNTIDFVVDVGGSITIPSGLRVKFAFASAPRRSVVSQWRVASSLQNWEDKLAARAAQDGNLLADLQGAIQQTESQTLQPLRDALVAACASGGNPVSSDWVAGALLIDVSASSEQRTTRVAQAIQTMQEMFLSFVYPQMRAASAPSTISKWTLNEPATDFVSEWRAWLASFEDWQAAMRAFLFPENVLFPSVRYDYSLSGIPWDGEPIAPWTKSSVFDQFVSSLESLPALTSDAVVNAANSYLSSLKPFADAPKELTDGSSTLGLFQDASTVDVVSLAEALNTAFSTYELGQSPNAKATAFLWEAWYFVPLQIALELQKAGQFELALDWLRLVYAYDLPITGANDNTRKIFYGLQLEPSTSSFAQYPLWYNFPNYLGPHFTAMSRAFPYSTFAMMSMVQCLLDLADAQFAADDGTSADLAQLRYREALSLLNQVALTSDPNVITRSNSVPTAMQQRGLTNLTNLRSGRNFAGLITPNGGAGAASSIQPSAYRYSALMDRAKDLTALAQQVEGTYLAALAAAENETYTELKASQDLQTAIATITLQTIQEKAAYDGIMIAADQKQMALDAAAHYSGLLDPSSDIQKNELDAWNAYADAQTVQSNKQGPDWLDILGSLISTTPYTGVSNYLGSMITADTLKASALEAAISFEEKEADWQLGLIQANIDVDIGTAQVSVATDQLEGARQQLSIAQMQADHASATLAFLANKFTNAALYRWMSSVLSGVYAYFLRQATSMARLAEQQLAFERQTPALSLIRADYWQPLASANAPNSTGGLTGAESLLQDITRVDQVAFETDQVKLQITKSISLAQLDPFAFALFLKDGILRFSTQMELFDRDFPGQYLRLISQVRVSVSALIPPVSGINATLASHGISRVVIKDDSGVFQTVVVRRDPQLIALSSPNNSTGLFPLTVSTQSPLLLPFEDLGVDTTWEFVMPKASNAFDYSTIADVILSIDYTALDSPDYRATIIAQLKGSKSADRAYSFRQQFPDAWFALNNSLQSPIPFTVSFTTDISDFPANLENVSIGQLLLYLIPSDRASFQLQPTLQFTPSGSTATIGGTAGAPPSPTDFPAYVFSTRQGNAAAWQPIIGQGVTGSWELSLPNTPATATVFQAGQVSDILFIVTYNADIPAWPS